MFQTWRTSVETTDPGIAGRHTPTRPAKKLPARKVLERYDICDRTLDRWLEKIPNFPRPIVINRRRYFDEDALNDFDKSRESA